ncbi:DUF4362 domain-containing protein [Gorillibacterium sp. sgz5001074]|uniref:DUF4362 domain-containing protein n=1 Tax=Gorillibacterium sp. sgz5001074 TaxID=3446695 RepID=UPI003F667516
MNLSARTIYLSSRYPSLFVSVLAAFLIAGCTQAPPSATESAVSKGEVVSDYGTVGNLAKLEEFLRLYQHQQPGNVTVTRFTKEGDPIYFRLTTEQGLVQVDYDDSHDRFGGGNSGTYTCRSLGKTAAPSQPTVYALSGCSAPGRDETLLTVPAGQGG